MTVWRTREATIQYKRRELKEATKQVLSSSDPAAKIITELVGSGTVERIVVLCVDNRLALTCYGVVSQGGESSSVLSPSEVLRLAILSGSAAIILGHNHPSGDTTPSEEDSELTKRMREACSIMSIRLLDHIIVNSDGDFFSFLDTGLLRR